MSPKTRRSSSSSGSVSLPPILRNIPKVAPDQAIAGIQQFGKQSLLNRCQLKRLIAVCQNAYDSSACNDEVQRLLARVYTRGRTWRSVGPLESLVLLPDEMKTFETMLSRFGAPQSFTPSPEDERSENAAIASAFERILSNEQTRSRAMTLRGRHAELFVSYLQTALDLPPKMNSKVREEWIRALRKLAVEAEVLPSDLKIEEVTLIGTDPVAQGGFSDVYQGKWKDKLVAVKRPRCFTAKDNSEVSKQVRREILLWRQLDRKYVLPLLGIFNKERPLDDMISEWMPNGTLSAFLEKNPNRNRLQLLCQVASAVKYLHTHSPPIAHGDIKAKNIFVNSSTCPVIGDFGQSCLRYTIDRTLSSTLEGGSIRWMAPELLLSNSDGDYASVTPTLESDMWSFGMLVLEALTEDVPYANMPDLAVFFCLTQKQELPARPSSHITERGLTDDIWTLLNTCWNFTHPKERPSATDLLERLKTLSRDIQITAENERTKTMFIPKTLVKQIIVSNAATWKSLDVRIVEESKTIIQKNTHMAIIQVVGRAVPVASACLQIEDSIKKSADIRVTDHVDIPKEYHSRMIGHKHCNHRKLEKLRGVQITFPTKQSPSSQVSITGSAEAVKKTKDSLRESLWFERNSRDVLEVSFRVAEKVNEQRERILRSPLWRLKVEYQGDRATITLRGKKEGIIIARNSIRAIEEEVKQEITEDIPLDTFLYDMIVSDRQVWVDIVDRCEGPPHPDSDKYPFTLSISPDSIQVRGPPNLVKALRTEVGELRNIGHDYVLAKRISAHRHQSLLDTLGGLKLNLRKCAKAMVYFPKSGGYKYIGKPQNMDHYGDNIDFREIIKVVGTLEECRKAREYLEDLIEEQRRQERNPVYKFPAILHDAIKRKLDPRFDTLGVTVESKVPTSNNSILCLVGDDQDLVTSTGPGWSIHIQDAPESLPMCEMRLTCQTDQDSMEAGQALIKEVKTLWRRIGVLKLQRTSHVLLVKEKLDILTGQSDDVFCQVIEQPTPCRLAIGGPSTDAVEKVIHGAIALIEAEVDEI